MLKAVEKNDGAASDSASLLFTGIFYYDVQEEAQSTITSGLAPRAFYITREHMNRVREGN